MIKNNQRTKNFTKQLYWENSIFGLQFFNKKILSTLISEIIFIIERSESVRKSYFRSMRRLSPNVWLLSFSLYRFQHFLAENAANSMQHARIERKGVNGGKLICRNVLHLRCDAILFVVEDATSLQHGSKTDERFNFTDQKFKQFGRSRSLGEFHAALPPRVFSAHENPSRCSLPFLSRLQPAAEKSYDSV